MSWTTDPDLWQPAPRTLRQFSGLWVAFWACLAAWRASRQGMDGMAWVLAGAAPLGIVGLLRPAAMRPVWTAWMILAFPVGWLVSRLVLACLFYGLFTPLGLAFRLFGRDALALRPRPHDNSYWRPKPPPGNAKSYFRQSS
ncbi:MAG: SxtJ family membrane protein [Gemmataceae bacterium]|nr:SxtJ family membrane protein [Gemmataceae bacterium]